MPIPCAWRLVDLLGRVVYGVTVSSNSIIGVTPVVTGLPLERHKGCGWLDCQSYVATRHFAGWYMVNPLGMLEFQLPAGSGTSGTTRTSR